MFSRDEISTFYTPYLLTWLYSVQGKEGLKGEISPVPVAVSAKQLEWMLIPHRVCTP